MKKSLYFAALGAVLLSACSDGNDDVFDKSAAERLEDYKTEYAKTLTQDGGLWEVEYFSNEEEPGYVFIMKFNDDMSVDMTANHKWIDDEVRSESSLWNMIADNGPVLSFNSYNNLFHIFSDPKNITGPNAPSVDNGTGKTDVDETGYGHDGDYEFQVMEVSDDKSTIRLMGKKHLYYMYMHRMDPATDVEKYLNNLKDVEKKLFIEKLNSLIFVDSDGARYIVNDAYKGVMKVYPEDGDAVDQTRTGNFIITPSGIRFRTPFEIERADGSTFTVEEFKFVNNLSLANVDDENAVLSAGSFNDVFYKNQRNWKIELGSMSDGIKEAFTAFEDEVKKLYKYNSAKVTDFGFEYDTSLSCYLLKISFKTSGMKTQTDRYIVNLEDDGGKLKISIGDPADDASGKALNAFETMQKLFGLLAGSYSVVTPSDMAPSTMALSSSNGGLTISLI